MPRHSKNNTASSVFTYHESKKLEYGTKRQRLGRDSFRNYDACFLCLQTAKDPVCCGKGHLACRECMYESILQQKQSIKQEQKRLELKQQEMEISRQQEEMEAKQALLDKFDKTQHSVLGDRRSTIKDELKDEDRGEKDTSSKSRKRKFELSEDEIRSMSEKEIEKTTIELRREKEAAAKPKLGSFWVPSVTPSADDNNTTIEEPAKKQVLCSAVEKAHPLSIKSLIDVKFQMEDKDKKICPACLKSFTNASKLSVLRNCGHVICNHCVNMFVTKSKACYVCEKKTKTKDIIDMSPEGTGFASASTKAVAEKFNLAFQ